MLSPSELKVAIVHYWFVGNGGGERVTEALADIFPQADLFSLVADRRTITSNLRGHRLTTSFLQHIPGSQRWYRHMLPLHPLAVEQFNLSGYDLVLSSESGAAKGVLSAPETCHISYCHSPMRYLWDLSSTYQEGMGTFTGLMLRLTAHYVRIWDYVSAARVDYFVANSQNVASRIRRHYRRDATVIYPPVNVEAGFLTQNTDDYYLVVSRLVRYKRIDLAIEACNRLSRPLRIIGDGEQYKQLRKLAGPTVQFLGRLEDSDVRDNYARCRALLFPGEEDFGIVPVEAQSFGRPVIAYGRGGALESIQGGVPNDGFDIETATGIFFPDQSVAALSDAIQFFESVESRFSPAHIRRSVSRFRTSRFKSEMTRFISERLADHRAGLTPPTNKMMDQATIVS